MGVPISYLDSSAIVKRYLREAGSDIVKELYMGAYNGELAVAFSIFNIGEVLSVFDKVSRKLNDERLYATLRRMLLSETRRMVRLKICHVIPLTLGILKTSLDYIEEFHLYIADTIQLASAKRINATDFYTGDRKLCEAASDVGLNCVYLGGTSPSK